MVFSPIKEFDKGSAIGFQVTIKRGSFPDKKNELNWITSARI
jgi:hypothetical protein